MWHILVHGGNSKFQSASTTDIQILKLAVQFQDYEVDFQWRVNISGINLKTSHHAND